MPPKARYTRQQIARTAFELIRTQGVEALTARTLGSVLHTSPRPIFTAFSGMDELRYEARNLAMEEFRRYLQDYRRYSPAFKWIGMRIVSFSMQERELFKLLFMQPHAKSESLDSAVADMGEIADVCRELIREEYGMDEAQARLLLEQMWTQTYGLCSMCVLGVCRLSEEEIGKRLGMLFAGQVMLIKSDKLSMVYDNVIKNEEGEFHDMTSAEFIRKLTEQEG